MDTRPWLNIYILNSNKSKQNVNNLLHTYVFIDQLKKNTSVSANILEKGKVV